MEFPWEKEQFMGSLNDFGRLVAQIVSWLVLVENREVQIIQRYLPFFYPQIGSEPKVFERSEGGEKPNAGGKKRCAYFPSGITGRSSRSISYRLPSKSRLSAIIASISSARQKAIIALASSSSISGSVRMRSNATRT